MYTYVLNCVKYWQNQINISYKFTHDVRYCMVVIMK